MAETNGTSSEKAFTLAVSDTDLDLLRRKLDLVRFPDELDDAGWHSREGKSDPARRA